MNRHEPENPSNSRLCSRVTLSFSVKNRPCIRNIYKKQPIVKEKTAKTHFTTQALAHTGLGLVRRFTNTMKYTNVPQ